MGSHESLLSPEPWTWSGRRVLIEQADEDRSAALAGAFRMAGFAIAICPGPGPGDRCPLAVDAGCAAAVDAHAVVSALGVGSPEAREALAALRLRAPGVPLLVEAEPGAVTRWPELLGGCDIVAPSATPEQVVAAVQATIEREESR
jgi:hypothetical protein